MSAITTSHPSTPAFDVFYRAVEPTVWSVTAEARGRAFHGGVPCRDRECIEDCRAYADEALRLLFLDWERKCAAGERHDPVEFARRRANSRFTDGVRKLDHDLYGASTQIRRMVHQSRWIDEALEGDADAKAILEQLVWHAQGHGRPDPGHVWPIERIADSLGVSPDVVERRIDLIVSRLEAADPVWCTTQLWRHSRHLSAHAWVEDLATVAPGEEDDDDLRHARIVLAEVEERLRRSGRPADEAEFRQVLREEVARWFGAEASNRVPGNPTQMDSVEPDAA